MGESGQRHARDTFSLWRGKLIPSAGDRTRSSSLYSGTLLTEVPHLLGYESSSLILRGETYVTILRTRAFTAVKIWIVVIWDEVYVHSEDGGDGFFRNFGNHLQEEYVAQQPRILQSSYHFCVQNALFIDLVTHCFGLSHFRQEQ
jgi:hypothetical protein